MIISFGTAVESKMKPIVNKTIPSLAPEMRWKTGKCQPGILPSMKVFIFSGNDPGSSFTWRAFGFGGDCHLNPPNVEEGGRLRSRVVKNHVSVQKHSTQVPNQSMGTRRVGTYPEKE